MKTTILTSFVTIALAVNTLATALPAGVVPAAVDPLVRRVRIPAGLPATGTAEVRRFDADLVGPDGNDHKLSVRDGNGANATTTNFRPRLGLAAAPHKDHKRADALSNDAIDIQYLNFALLLEQMESTFYDRAMARYSDQDFFRAGYPVWVRGRYRQIAEHEKMHKEFLQSAITAAGSDHVQPCEYEFHDRKVRDFIDISEAIDTIIASAYTGTLQYFSNKGYATASAAILSEEARQASWVNSAIRKQNPWGSAFETALTPNQVISLFSNFFNYDTCASANRNLLPAGLHTYPQLRLSSRMPGGQESEIFFQPSSSPSSGELMYVAFLAGAETIFAPVLERDGGRHFVSIPTDLMTKGTVFVVVVKGGANIGEVRMDDASIVAGPAIAAFPFDADGTPLMW